VSSRLTETFSIDAILQSVCDAIRTALDRNQTAGVYCGAVAGVKHLPRTVRFTGSEGHRAGIDGNPDASAVICLYREGCPNVLDLHCASLHRERMRSVVHDAEVSFAIEGNRAVVGTWVNNQPTCRSENYFSPIGQPELTPLPNGGGESPGNRRCSGFPNLSPEKTPAHEDNQYCGSSQVR